MVNLKLISKVIGSLLLLEAGFMLLSLGVALIYGTSDLIPFIISMAITLAAGVGLLRLYVQWHHPQSHRCLL